MNLNVHLELGDGAKVEQRETWIDTEKIAKLGEEGISFALMVGDYGGLYTVVRIQEEKLF